MRQSNALRGTGQVFRFSLAQLMKNKANIVSLAILLLFALASVPVMTWSMGGGVKTKTSEIEKVYLENHTKLSLQASDFAGKNAEFAETEFAEGAPLEGEQTGKQVLVEFSQNPDGSFQIDVKRLSDRVLKEEELSDLEELMREGLESARYKALGLSEEQMREAFVSYQAESGTLEDYQKGGENASMVRYVVQLVYAVVVLMASVMAVSYIVRSVVEEKASKLVEVLMISVRPLALILGKILAVMVFVFGMFLALAAGIGISYWVSGMFLDVSSVGAMLAESGFSWEMLNLSPATAGIMLVSMLLGYLTFSILAGLTAAGCSSMEDLEGATTVSVLLMLAGYVFSVMASASGSSGMTLFASLCPVISIFSAPVQYMLGNIGWGTLAAAWALQGIVVVLLAALCAKVYENLLMYRGNRLKFSQILSLARRNREKEAE